MSFGSAGFAIKSTNMLERLNEGLKRRTLVAWIFPNTASCLRLAKQFVALKLRPISTALLFYLGSLPLGSLPIKGVHCSWS